MPLIQSDPSRTFAYAGFVPIWRWGSLAPAHGSIRCRREHTVAACWNTARPPFTKLVS